MRRLVFFCLLFVLAGVQSAWAISVREIEVDQPSYAAKGSNIAPGFHVYPSLQNVTTTSFQLLFETDCVVAARFEIDGVDKEYWFGGNRFYCIEVSDLRPDTTYRWELGLAAANKKHGDYITKNGKARTFPKKSDKMTFLVYGDTRSLPARHKKVAEAMSKEKNIALVMVTGDLVGDGHDERSWEREYLTPAANAMRSVPFYPCLGNHDHNSRHFYRYFSLPRNERYYSLTYGGDFYFAVIDSNIDFAKGSKQYNWLVSDLAKNRDKKWKFITLHHPPYSSGNHSGVNKNGTLKERPIRIGRPLIHELAQKYGITATFAGHDHAYERSERDGTMHFVCGGGGAPNYSNANAKHNPWSKKFYSGLHYLKVEIDGDSARFTAITPDGEVIDTKVVKSD